VKKLLKNLLKVIVLVIASPAILIAAIWFAAMVFVFWLFEDEMTLVECWNWAVEHEFS
jgi:hypothetical protein